MSSISINLPTELYKKISDSAKRNMRTLSAEIVYRLSDSDFDSWRDKISEIVKFIDDARKNPISEKKNTGNRTQILRKGK